jgi:hypothetical protein
MPCGIIIGNLSRGRLCCLEHFLELVEPRAACRRVQALLCCLFLKAVHGGMGPCTLPGQLEILLGFALTGVGGLVRIVSIPRQEIQDSNSKFCPLTFRSTTSPPLTAHLK